MSQVNLTPQKTQRTEQHQQVTCVCVASFVRHWADGPQKRRSGLVFVQVELSPGVITVLDHAYPGFFLADMKGAGSRRDEGAYVFEVWPAHAPGAVHQEHHIADDAGRASCKKSSRMKRKKTLNIKQKM